MRAQQDIELLTEVPGMAVKNQDISKIQTALQELLMN